MGSVRRKTGRLLKNGGAETGKEFGKPVVAAKEFHGLPPSALSAEGQEF